MKKWLSLIIMVCAVICITACSDFETNTNTGDTVIDESITVEQSLKDNWEWTEFDANAVNYSVFPVQEGNEESEYRYAVISAEKPSKNGRMPVAVVYYKKSNDDLFQCPGKMLIEASDGLGSGDSRIFGPYPIGDGGEYRDICVGYSSIGWFMVNDEEMACQDSGLIIYIAKHGFEIQFGRREPKE